MDCESANSELSALADGRLDARGRQRIESHVAVCARCRADLREIRAVRQMLGRLPEPQARPGLTDDLLRAVRTRMPQRRPTFSTFRLASAAAAAALLIAAYVATQQPTAVDKVGPQAASIITIDPASLVSMHTRERSRSPLIDVAKMRVSGSEAEAADLANDGRIDIQ